MNNLIEFGEERKQNLDSGRYLTAPENEMAGGLEFMKAKAADIYYERDTDKWSASIR